MTRSTDVFVTITRRWQMAENWKANLFLSIHCDASGSDSANGFEILWYNDYSKATIGQMMKAEMEKIGRWNRWIYGDYAGVLVHAKMSALLTENKFLTNGFDASQLATEEYRQQIAQAHANAVFSYFGTQPVEEDDDMPVFTKVATKDGSIGGKAMKVDVYGCWIDKNSPTLIFDRDISADTKMKVYIKPFDGKKDDREWGSGGYDNSTNHFGTKYPLDVLFGYTVPPGWVYVHVPQGDTFCIGGLK